MAWRGANDRATPIELGLDLGPSARSPSLAGPLGDCYLARVHTEREIVDRRTASGIDPRRLAALFAAKEPLSVLLGAAECRCGTSRFAWTTPMG